MTNTPLRKTKREAHKISKCDSNGVTNKILKRIMSMDDKMGNIFPFFEHLSFQLPLFPKLDKSEARLISEHVVHGNINKTMNIYRQHCNLLTNPLPISLIASYQTKRAKNKFHPQFAPNDILTLLKTLIYQVCHSLHISRLIKIDK